MKHIYLGGNLKITIIMVFLMVLFTTCEKPERVVKLTTLDAELNDISYTSATLKGELTDLGSKPIEQHGLLISESSFPNLGQTNTTEHPMGSAKTKGIFSYQFTGLKKNTTYYFRAFAVVSSVPQFGEIKQFKTKDTEVPTVTAGTISNITLTSASLNGEVTSENGEPVTKRGLCWGTSPNPTIANFPDTTINGSGTGTFTGLMHGLTAGTTYYARTYAINAKGTAYNAADVVFTTQNLPVATTVVANPVSNTTATLNGTVNANNLSSVVTFEYGTTTAYGQTATASQSPVTGNTTTNVSASITGLLQGTLYHFRVKAVSTAGTSLGGSDLTFTTLEPPVAVTSAASPVANTTATLNGTVNAKNSSTNVTFEYGTTTAYGTTVTASQSPVTGNSATPVTYDLTGLTPGETYHFRVKASSAGGQSDGLDQTFTTLQPPIAVTGTADNITSTGARFNGTINARNSSTTVTFEYGPTISYGTTVTATQSPVTGNTATNVSATVSGLDPSTTYHFRVKASSAGGTGTGNDASFNTDIQTTVTDYDGNIYNVVKIGTQDWMKENLKVKHFSEGTPITLVESVIWTEATYPAYCNVNGNVSNFESFGNLYNFYVAKDSRNACPTGWHVPTESDWNNLEANLGGTSVAGGKLKEQGLAHWFTPNTNATNSTGFTGLPGGYRYYTWWNYVWGPFMYFGDWGCYWEANALPYARILYASSEGLGRIYSDFKSGMSIRCVKGELPLVATNSPTAITSTTATLNGKVNPNGASTSVTYEYGPTTAYGTEVAATQSPVSGSVPVTVSADLTGLTTGTTYHYRVKAINSGGTSYGSDLTFTTDPVDADGNAYHTVMIGNQLWTKENLKTTKYKDGTSLLNATDNSAWGGAGTGAYCWYDNDAATYKNTYGALYNFYAVTDPKGLCPDGWHVPSHSEWVTLVTYLGGEPGAGGKMKEAGTLHWSDPNAGADNSSGFTALPAGDRSGGGFTFNNINTWAHFWSTTVNSSIDAFGRELYNTDPGIGVYPYDKLFGFSVRCIKD